MRLVASSVTASIRGSALSIYISTFRKELGMEDIYTTIRLLFQILITVRYSNVPKTVPRKGNRPGASRVHHIGAL